MTYEYVLYERRGHVALVTLNKPEKRNAWDRGMWHDSRAAFNEACADPAVGAIVLTGAGKGFCAGADIGGFKARAEADDRGETTDPNAEDPLRGHANWIDYIQGLPKPTIAAVNGVAVGIGVTKILPMDFRIASEAASFGFFFVRMGLVPELASSALLPRLVGAGRARDWCLTGRLVGPEEALAAGLVSEVVAPDRLVDRALELGEQLAANSAPSMASIRRLLIENAGDPDTLAVLDREVVALDEMRRSWEHREAIAAFFDKRPPDFTKKP
jgi:enoyl-CoA hydratase/carnithine racemase